MRPENEDLGDLAPFARPAFRPAPGRSWTFSRAKRGGEWPDRRPASSALRVLRV